LLPKLMDDCYHLLGQHFILQQDGALELHMQQNRPNSGLQLTVLHRQGRMASKQPGLKST